MEDSVVIIAFYKFVKLEDYRAMKAPLEAFCVEQGLKGTILFAEEGINSTISGSREGIDNLFAHLRSDERFADLEGKESYLDYQPFNRMKVRLKNEIVTIGISEVDPVCHVGSMSNPRTGTI